MKYFIFLIVSLFLFVEANAQKRQKFTPIPFDSSLYEGKMNFLNNYNISQHKKPNVILIVADDLGKFDLSLYGNPFIQTPNIDALGNEGIVFNTGYASAPVCSPSRAGFLTGRYQQRYGYHLQPHQRYANNKLELWVFQKLVNTSYLSPENYTVYPSKQERKKEGLPNSEITIAELLKSNGYRTAIVGKWNLGYYAPMLAHHFGFDYTYGFNEAYTLFAYPKDKNIVNARINEFTDKVIWRKRRKGACAIYENGLKIKEKEYLTYAFIKRAKQFIGSENKQPFFLYLPVNAPHTPYQAPKNIYNQLEMIKDHHKRVYYAMVLALDKAIGDLVTFLKETNQFENTLIILTSDNGAALYSKTIDNLPLNGGKFTLFEGGVNVPFLMSFPNQLKTPIRIQKPVSLLDIFPTIAEVTETKLPEDREYDGVSLLEVFKGDTLQFDQQREALYWYIDYNSSIRIGDYKLIINDLDDTIDLYNLKTDPYEKLNLSTNLEEIEQLKVQLEEWKKTMKPNYWPRVMNYEVEINGKIYRWGV